jgi:hypothetical protein
MQNEAPMRELYASPNGDRWYLVVDEASGHTFVRHASNEASGGNVAIIPLSAFLADWRSGPEHQEIWALLRRIVEEAV